MARKKKHGAPNSKKSHFPSSNEEGKWDFRVSLFPQKEQKSV
jgi:hypothetical protein